MQKGTPKYTKGEQGFIGLIVLIIIALILAKYFLNFDVYQAAATPQGQQTVGYTHSIFSTIWSYIGTPFSFAWNKVIWPALSLAWQNFQNFLAWGHATASTPIR